MSKIKGQNLVVLFRGADYQWKALAYATTCELDLNRDMQQVGSASSGNWKHYKPKEMGWTVTSAHLLSDAEQPVDIDKLLVEGTEVQITFTMVKDHPLPQPDPPQYNPDFRFYGPPYGYPFTRTGMALVRRHTVTARNKTFVTSSIELLGNGPLVNGPDDRHDFGPTNAPDFGPAQNPDFNV